MAEGFSLVDLKGIAEPAKVLIEKISDAIGGYYRPKQITRVARAEAEAELIRTEAEIQANELRKRALTRFIEEEAKKQENIENITATALPELEEGSNPANMEDDWITNFFDKCRIVSDKEMQSLWAKVLAGEANSPGKFSKRTVNFIATLDKKEAALFSKMCSFAVGDKDPTLLIYDETNLIYSESGINFVELKNFDSMGLIKFDSTSGFKIYGKFKQMSLQYFGDHIALEFPNEIENELSTGRVLFTKMGLELFHLCNPNPLPGFWDYCQSKFQEQGLKVIKVHRPQDQ
jgi:hypothetical protein